MNNNLKAAGNLPSNGPDRGRSQAVFVTVGFGILFGGLWLLYQSDDGPYHPDNIPFEADIQLAAEN